MYTTTHTFLFSSFGANFDCQCIGFPKTGSILNLLVMQLQNLRIL